MFELDQTQGFEPVPQTEGISARLVSGDFDEVAKTGARTRVVRFDAGGQTFAPFVHDYWEEVYLLEGRVRALDGTDVSAPAYVIRPPGTEHGPFLSTDGCLMLEVQYYASRDKVRTEFLDEKAPATGA